MPPMMMSLVENYEPDQKQRFLTDAQRLYDEFPEAVDGGVSAHVIYALLQVARERTFGQIDVVDEAVGFALATLPKNIAAKVTPDNAASFAAEFKSFLQSLHFS